MKKALWWLGGLCAATAGFLVLGARRVPPVEALERKRETAWMDEPAPAEDPAYADEHAPTAV
jgi:hypothetical protein